MLPQPVASQLASLHARLLQCAVHMPFFLKILKLRRLTLGSCTTAAQSKHFCGMHAELPSSSWVVKPSRHTSTSRLFCFTKGLSQLVQSDPSPQRSLGHLGFWRMPFNSSSAAWKNWAWKIWVRTYWHVATISSIKHPFGELKCSRKIGKHKSNKSIQHWNFRPRLARELLNIYLHLPRIYGKIQVKKPYMEHLGILLRQPKSHKFPLQNPTRLCHLGWTSRRLGLQREDQETKRPKDQRANKKTCPKKTHTKNLPI